MKFLKVLFALLGVVGLIAGAVFLFQSWIDIRSVVAVANANKNEGVGLASPFPKVGLAAGLAALGALLLGLGIAWPRMTEGGIRRHVLEAQRTTLNDEITTAERHRVGEPVHQTRAQRRSETTDIRPE